MTVPVYYADLSVKNPADNRLGKIRRLCEAVGLADKVKPLLKGGEDEHPLFDLMMVDPHATALPLHVS